MSGSGNGTSPFSMVTNEKDGRDWSASPVDSRTKRPNNDIRKAPASILIHDIGA
jgi:hypothetical protein